MKKRDIRTFFTVTPVTNRVPTIDGVSGDKNIANLMASKVEKILNTHSIKSCADLSAIECIAARKSDASSLFL